MKVRYIFETDDFKGGGQLLTRSPVNSAKPMSGSFCYKVGYQRLNKETSYYLISMADGAIYDKKRNLEEFCNYMNSQVGDGFRPLTELECRQLGGSLTNRFRKSELTA